MVLTLERAGLLRREPGASHSIEALVPAAKLARRPISLQRRHCERSEAIHAVAAEPYPEPK
jgi:hypothetical protein